MIEFCDESASSVHFFVSIISFFFEFLCRVIGCELLSNFHGDFDFQGPRVRSSEAELF